MTISDALAAARVAATPSGTAAVDGEKARAHVHARARVRSLPVTVKIRDVFRLVWADVRSAWWTPASLPTLTAAWAERMPDRESVPGGNALLYGGWVVYNHTLRLALTAAALVVVGALTAVVWMAQHPARLVLFTIVATATAALIIH